MANFWAGVGQGFARGFEKSWDAASRRKEREEERKLRKKDAEDAQAKADERAREIAIEDVLRNKNKSWSGIDKLKKEASLDPVSLSPEAKEEAEGVFQGYGSEFQKLQSGEYGRFIPEKSAEEVIREMKLPKLLALQKDEAALRAVSIKNQEDLKEAYYDYLGVEKSERDSDWQNKTPDYFMKQAADLKAGRDELARQRKLWADTAVSYGNEGERGREKLNEWKKTVPTEEHSYINTIFNNTVRDKESSISDEEAQYSRELARSRGDVFNAYGGDIKKAFEAAKGKEFDGDKNHFAFMNPTTAQSFLNEHKDLKQAQDSYSSFIRRGKGEGVGFAEMSYKNPEFVNLNELKMRIGLMNDIDKSVLTSHLGEMRKAPYEYVTIKNKDDEFQYRTWQIKAGQHERMNPETDEGKKNIEAANEGLEIEAGVWGDEKGPIAVRKRMVSDIEKAFKKANETGGPLTLKNLMRNIEDGSNPKEYRRTPLKPKQEEPKPAPEPKQEEEAMPEPKEEEPPVRRVPMSEIPQIGADGKPIEVPVRRRAMAEIPQIGADGKALEYTPNSEEKIIKDYIETLPSSAEKSLFIEALEASYMGPVPEDQQSLLDRYRSWRNNWKRSIGQ
tara:strand:+ start:14 stop:1861 length:1848 start_codon:yes stop_codon:yes gene_type:complete